MKTDICETITATIIDAIEAGCAKFEMPWNVQTTLPLNARTERPYRGVNVLVLWAQGMKHGYTAALWGTYQQWQELGAQVRKGEKSTAIVFWKFYGEDAQSGEEADTLPSTDRKGCVARA